MTPCIVFIGKPLIFNVDEEFGRRYRSLWIDTDLGLTPGAPAPAGGRTDKFKELLTNRVDEKDRGETIDYFVLCPLHLRNAIEALFQTATAVRQLHAETVNQSYELNAVLVLPPVDASPEEKALTYQALGRVEHNQLSALKAGSVTETRFDFVWILRGDPGNGLSRRLDCFLRTDTHRSFNNEARNGVASGKFLDRSCSYSTFDAYRFVYPVQQLKKVLGERLVGTIIERTISKKVDQGPEAVEVKAEEFEKHLREINLESRIDELESKALGLEMDSLVRGFEQEDIADIGGFIERLYVKLDILFQRAAERTIKSDVEPYLGRFSASLRSWVEAVMDDPERGLDSSTAFLAYILDKKRLARKSSSMAAPALQRAYTLHTVLLDPIRNDAKHLLEADLGEIIRRMMKIYVADGPEIVWQAMERTPLEILCDLEATIDFSLLTEEQKTRADIFRKMREEITWSMERLDELVLDTPTWRRVFQTLEVLVKELARKKLQELLSKKKELEIAFARLNEHKRRTKPLLCGRRKYVRLLAALQDLYDGLQKEYEEGKKALSSIIMDRKNFIFHQTLLLALYERLIVAAESAKHDVDDFADKLDWLCHESLKPPEFEDDEVTRSVVSPGQVTEFYPDDQKVQELAIEFWGVLVGSPTAKLSPYYRNPNEFSSRLVKYARACFAKLENSSMEDVLAKLRIDCHDMLSSMSSLLKSRSLVRPLPDDKVASQVYIGVENDSKTRLKEEHSLSALQMSYGFFSSGDRHAIDCLHITHGFTLFAVENILDLKRNHEALIGNAVDAAAPELIPEGFAG
jgi:hypothetical protein